MGGGEHARGDGRPRASCPRGNDKGNDEGARAALSHDLAYVAFGAGRGRDERRDRVARATRKSEVGPRVSRLWGISALRSIIRAVPAHSAPCARAYHLSRDARFIRISWKTTGHRGTRMIRNRDNSGRKSAVIDIGKVILARGFEFRRYLVR